MAKKKVSHSHHEKQSQKQDESVKPNHQVTSPAMDSDVSEKLENLKSLNQMLLKEAFERRQQVESLSESKLSLESELNLSNLDREALKSELTELSLRAARLELESSVVDVFVSGQVDQKLEVVERKMNVLEKEVDDLKRVINEKESEIGRLNEKILEVESALRNEREILSTISLEKDNVNDKLDLQILETKALKANLIDLEDAKREMELEIGNLRVSYDFLVGEKKEREHRIESVMREKELMEKSLVESNKLIEVMKEEHLKVVREKERIEEEKHLEVAKRHESENAVTGLNEMVMNLQEEEHKLRSYMGELEKKNIGDEERQKELASELARLVEELKSGEERFAGLVVEKNVTDKNLVDALNQIDEQKLKIDEIVSDRIDVLEIKGKLDCEVAVLKNQVAELNVAIQTLESSGAVKGEIIKGLESEVEDCKCKFEQVIVERDEIGFFFDNEKKIAAKLKEKIDIIEKSKEEILKAIDEAKAENVEISIQKKELNGQCELLKKEIKSLESGLMVAQTEFESMKGKYEAAEASAKLVVSMLKETSLLCAKDAGNGNQEAVQNYELDFEIIKNAFKSKETQEENMKRQMEVLQKSVEDAHKKKSFWTVLSSATTLLAAMSLAYVARGH